MDVGLLKKDVCKTKVKLKINIKERDFKRNKQLKKEFHKNILL